MVVELDWRCLARVAACIPLITSSQSSDRKISPIRSNQVVITRTSVLAEPSCLCADTRYKIYAEKASTAAKAGRKAESVLDCVRSMKRLVSS